MRSRWLGFGVTCLAHVQTKREKENRKEHMFRTNDNNLQAAEKRLPLCLFGFQWCYWDALSTYITYPLSDLLFILSEFVPSDHISCMSVGAVSRLLGLRGRIFEDTHVTFRKPVKYVFIFNVWKISKSVHFVGSLKKKKKKDCFNWNGPGAVAQ